MAPGKRIIRWKGRDGHLKIKDSRVLHGMLKIADICLLAGLIALGVMLTFFVVPSLTKSTSANEGSNVTGVARVTWDGDFYGEYDLSVDKIIPLKKKGRMNKIVISQGTVEIVEANCRNHTCVKKGKIWKGGQSIICVPNRVAVEIVLTNDSAYDAMAGE